MKVQKITDTELFEMLDDDVMCGGNIFPSKHPCPHGNRAVVAWRSLCDCPPPKGFCSEKAFKCIDCYSEWLEARVRRNSGKWLKCTYCGEVRLGPLGRNRYVPI